MTPQEQSEELIKRFLFYDTSRLTHGQAVECAIVYAEEIMKIVPRHEYGQGERVDSREYGHWSEVLQILKAKS